MLTHLFHKNLLSTDCELGIRDPVVKKADKVTVLKVCFINEGITEINKLIRK